ncbi:Golgi-associated plant pathogenesis-related 1-like [Paramuricea clavata]|uniref:Golgi-associated plant pathogenesis-related 1-like n=1 Tax=Paramuricea clavata TaxID=317549 RepID=A0A6S7J3Y5_PARCT|nr:Golgi-associated plant pathogenesis-related 1-like [Paramuricea clavata]
MHQAPDIKWSASLASDAQKWADYLAANNQFKHDPNLQGQGENLYGSSGDSQQSCRYATTAFYNEVKDYDFDNPGFTKGTGHFTQVVWVKSTEFGVAKAEKNSGGTILVFRYSPPGNYLGQFPENVKPKVSGVSTIPPNVSTIHPDNSTTPTGSAVCHGTSIIHILTIGILSLLLQALA